MKKRLILALAAVLMAGGILSIQAVVNKNKANDYKVVEAHRTYVANFKDKKMLVGASNNVFTGKVVQQIGTKKLGAIPETQFTVQVLENIKGVLPTIVTVNQQGGIHKNSLILLDGDPLLIPGETYLFATRYLAEENWHTVVPNYGDIRMNGNTVLELLTEFRNAYANEVVPEEFINR
ncbi:hypothetical protein [Cohnella panacarvi]|uniref:hypothetical protein n=1 Tax=Cohnella panacarvi TaxID=400776 RepID=UPI00047D6147|nr:hypothetical protein [Cohnella panacarvi]